MKKYLRTFEIARIAYSDKFQEIRKELIYRKNLFRFKRDFLIFTFMCKNLTKRLLRLILEQRAGDYLNIFTKNWPILFRAEERLKRQVYFTEIQKGIGDDNFGDLSPIHQYIDRINQHTSNLESLKIYLINESDYLALLLEEVKESKEDELETEQMKEFFAYFYEFYFDAEWANSNWLAFFLGKEKVKEKEKELKTKKYYMSNIIIINLKIWDSITKHHNTKFQLGSIFSL